MRVNKELKVIRELLSLTQEDLALNIGVSLDTISRWENEKTEIEEKNIDAIYNYALEKGINMNKYFMKIVKKQILNFYFMVPEISSNYH